MQICMEAEEKKKPQPGNNIGKTADALLEAGKLDYVYTLKNTYGGRDGKKLAVPNYLAGRISFALGA